MNVEWVRDREPDRPGRYIVHIEFPSFGYEFPSIRLWDRGWKLTAPSERIVQWLEGLTL